MKFDRRYLPTTPGDSNNLKEAKERSTVSLSNDSLLGFPSFVCQNTFRQSYGWAAWGACTFQDVRADGPSDASTTMPNRWCRKRGERRKARVTRAKTGERSTASHHEVKLYKNLPWRCVNAEKKAPRIKKLKLYPG